MADCFHMHDLVIDGYPCHVPIPGAVYECDDELCRTERLVIEGLAKWPTDRLDSHIAAYQDRVDKAVDMLIRLRMARELQQGGLE